MGGKSEIVTETVSGKIEGTFLNGLNIFKGVPYAAPPVGNLRWMPPQPHESWDGVRPAVDFSPIAPQTIMPNPALDAIRVLQRQSEDCLYLNIWSPGLDDAKRPVMVWIHGGAFNMGSGSEPLTDGTKLASRGDVVIVSFNYRLGLLGFLNLDEITGGSPYGASTIAGGDGSRMPSENELAMARFQGHHVATIARKLAGA